MSDRGGYQIRDQHAHYFLTFQVISWLDIFTRMRYRDIIIDSFKYCQDYKGLNIHAWVIMSNHIHCILSSKKNSLSDIIRDFKKHTSKEIIKSAKLDIESRREWIFYEMKKSVGKHKRNKNYQLWTHENHPIELHGEMYDQRLEYIHQNPVKAGIVNEAHHYLYSSAIAYNDGNGLLDIDYI